MVVDETKLTKLWTTRLQVTLRSIRGPGLSEGVCADASIVHRESRIELSRAETWQRSLRWRLTSLGHLMLLSSFSFIGVRRLLER